jgi:hydroxyethylthiazole kinase-like uncharacterized protein yjeF
MDIGEPLYRTGQIRAFDRAAIDLHGISAFELMTRAAHDAFALLEREWPLARRVTLLCGPGNNGGDGFVLARLAHAAGWRVRVIESGADEQRSAAAKRAASEWRVLGACEPATDATLTHGECDVLVDALLGIGLSRAPQGELAALIAAANASAIPVLALDVPSGLDADSGATPGAAIRASRTLEFIARKRGLATGRARALCGTLALSTLALPAAIRDGADPSAWSLAVGDLSSFLRPRARDAHKGHCGHVLAIGGDHGYGGAIRLCAQGAMRAGAGWVSAATRASSCGALLAAAPECMAHAVEEGGDAQALLERADVIAIGPGLARKSWGIDLFESALTAGKLLVLDADALNLLGAAPRAVSGAVLTPHPGEAARLLGVTVPEIESDRFAAADAIAVRYDAVVVLKGAGTVVGGVGRTSRVVGAGNPGMASAGMGDVLTGVIAALMAQGLDAFDAASAGALLHAAAGDVVAASDGERGMLASDLLLPLHGLANPA